jgi:2-dehydro-3-deoxyphosphooctonate aldolase (KDO 8-P synthase)
MRSTGCPIVFDATHSVQQPGGHGNSSGGERKMVPVLARAAIAAGVSGIFMETHPDPGNAKSDGSNSMPIDKMPALLRSLKEIDSITKNNSFIEDALND